MFFLSSCFFFFLVRFWQMGVLLCLSFCIFFLFQRNIYLQHCMLDLISEYHIHIVKCFLYDCMKNKYHLALKFVYRGVLNIYFISLEIRMVVAQLSKAIK